METAKIAASLEMVTNRRLSNRSSLEGSLKEGKAGGDRPGQWQMNLKQKVKGAAKKARKAVLALGKG